MWFANLTWTLNINYYIIINFKFIDKKTNFRKNQVIIQGILGKLYNSWVAASRHKPISK